VNIADPSNAVYQGFIDFQRYGDYDPVGLDLDNFYAYFIGKVGRAARLYIGQHSIVEDNNGIAPTVTVTKPNLNSIVYDGVVNDFQVEATDDVEVASVRFSVNGEPIGVVSRPPYRIGFQPPVGAADVTLSAVAFDIGGNESAPVEVTVPVEELVVGAGQLLLTVESSHASDTLPKLSKLVNYSEIDTQIKAARIARDTAVGGWSLDGLSFEYGLEAGWTGLIPVVNLREEKGDILGFDLSPGALLATDFPSRELVFHTDEVVALSPNNICESANNFGIISGLNRGRAATRECTIINWGRFYIEDVSGVAPEINYIGPDQNSVLLGGQT